MNRLTALILLGLMSACSDSTSPAAPPSVAEVSGDGQEAIVATALDTPLEVRLVDAQGDAVSGVSVQWQVVTGGGSLAPATVTTGSDGRAATVWTLGTTAGENQARAVIEGVNPVTFTASGAAGAPASMAMVSGDGQEEGAGSTLDSLAVQVVDAHGNAVGGVSVQWEIVTGGGSVDPESGITDPEGQASTVWTLGTATGENEARAVVEGVDSTAFTASATAGAPASVAIVSGDGQEAEAGSTLDSLAVRVEDAHGNAVGGAPVHWEIVTGGGAVDPASDTTSSEGLATAVWTVGPTAGEQTLNLNVSELTPLEFRATALAGEPTEWRAVPDASTEWLSIDQSDPISATVQVTDQHGNPVPDVETTLVLARFPSGPSSAGEILNEETVTTDETGLATGGGWLPGEVGGFVVDVESSRTPRQLPEALGGELQLGFNVYRPAHFQGVDGGTTGVGFCGLDHGGIVSCWHDNSDAGPRTVGGGMSFQAIAVSGQDVMGLTAAGAVYRVDNVQSPTNNPSQIAAPAFTQLVAGQAFYCGLTSGGEAYCWGSNSDGSLGSSPGQNHVITPTPVSEAVPFVSLQAGWRHACGLTEAGEAYCWGKNGWGQVGDGSQEDRWEAVRVTGSRSFSSLALGNRYSCGLEETGEVYCWGREFVEFAPWELPRLTPTHVATGFQFAEVAAGGYHTCGRQADGQVYCWGLNPFVQGILQTPAPLRGGHAFSEITANWYHTCGITEGGALCWGTTGGFPGYTHSEPDPDEPIWVTLP